MKRHKILNKIFVFIFSAICVAVCVCIAEVFATVLTVGSLEITFSSSNNLSEYKIYAISLGAFSTKTLAENSSKIFQQKNAGGYVLKLNGAYHVLASAYEKENDAKLVRDNLLEENITSEIIVISFNEIKLEKVSSPGQEKEFIESLNIFRTIYVDLYDTSVSLDTSVVDETKAKIQIISTKAKIEEEIERIKKGTTSIDGIYYQIIKNKYLQVIDILNDLKGYETKDGIILSSKIKYSYLQILDLAQDLIALLNNEI